MMLLLRVSWGGDQAWSSCRKPRPCTKTQLNQPPDKYSVYIQAYQSNTPGFSTWFNQLLFLTSLFREDYQTGFNFIWEADWHNRVSDLKLLLASFVWPQRHLPRWGNTSCTHCYGASDGRCRPVIWLNIYIYLFSWYICPAERDSFLERCQNQHLVFCASRRWNQTPQSKTRPQTPQL